MTFWDFVKKYYSHPYAMYACEKQSLLLIEKTQAKTLNRIRQINKELKALQNLNPLDIINADNLTIVHAFSDFSKLESELYADYDFHVNKLI
ncbi:hypothetical protein HLA87_02580 [Mycoplasma miroungigenitalium]|uniref:Uncharacterized protein n=1 Tax=Mycoplasma miroungigenitalium TaxID=754515 RepID=A0A6M4JC55_9MOLU|nr:hypothetical protein [Mycoplasma miroungigenitalium]QJR43659.1 hypothetical protein HLA87_02580 [Mycoplasma miroungigenitalium]